MNLRKAILVVCFLMKVILSSKVAFSQAMLSNSTQTETLKMVQLDSIIESDATRRSYMEANYLSVRGNTGDAEREQLRTIINALIKEYKRNLSESDSSDYYSAFINEIHINPIESSFTTGIHSVLYAYWFEYIGAAHPFKFYFSMNYDTLSHKEIKFSDYFHLKNLVDTLELSKLIAVKLFDGDTLSTALLAENPLIPSVFDLNGDSIGFYYGDYALGQGPNCMGVAIEKRDLQKFIDPKYVRRERKIKPEGKTD